MINNQFYNFFDNNDKSNELSKDEVILKSQGPTNEIDAPIITFIQPERNSTIIEQSSYTIIVNVTDDNPPLFGNVTFQISNSTDFFFNVSMDYDGGSQWSFNWNNITSYPNKFYRGYIIQIWAIDNSSNHNLGWSDVFYIYLNLPEQSPGIINVIIYLIAVIFIIAGIVVYLNKKLLPKSSDKKGMEINGI